MMSGIKMVEVFIWREKAYVPAHGRIQGSGPFVVIEPVFSADIVQGAIVQAVKSALSLGHPSVPAMTISEMDSRISPLLSATGAQNWSEFYRKAILYSIEWGPTGV